MVESGTLEQAPTLDFQELDALLSRSSLNRAASGHAIAPGLSAHDGHTNTVIPRPHFAARAGSRLRPRVITADASGRMRIELG